MGTIVAYPSVVKDALEIYGDLFANEPERRHFAEYLTGLIVADRKTVNGICGEFVETTDQSCLNRWLTVVDWDPHRLNDRRLAELQKSSKTRYSPRGVIAIDNTLIDHDGKLIEDVGYFWDHADQRYLLAHDYLISNYVCPSGAHYPIEWRRFKKQGSCLEEAFKTHTQLCIELIDDAIERGIPGDFTFDSYFTNAETLNHLASRGRSYVGDLKLNRKVVFNGREQKLSDVAARIPPKAKKPIRVGEKTYWYFTRRMRIPKVDHPVRIVLFWKIQDDPTASKALVSDRLTWEATRMLLVYRHRWTGTETFHRDAKQQLGLGECQVRHGEGQTRHVYLVSVAYSLLMTALQQARPQDWARKTLTTIGEACRATKAETLGQMIDWVLDKRLSHQWSVPQIKSTLGLPCPS